MNEGRIEVSIITVTWNSAEWIARQILSVQESCRGINYEHIVVDNASTDDTPAVVARFPDVIWVSNQSNQGFAAANNAAAIRARGQWFLFLNPDMELRCDMRTVLAHMKEYPAAAIAGGLLRHSDGALNTDALPRRFPTLADMVFIFLKLAKLWPRLLNRYLYRERGDWNAVQDVESVRGSCLLMKRELFAHCGFAFDPRYYIWFEDVDICREAIARGWRVLHLPVLAGVDHFGRSFARRGIIWKQAQFARSMFLYATKWMPLYASVLIGLLTWPVRMIGKICR